MRWKSPLARTPKMWASVAATASFIVFLGLGAAISTIATFITEAQRHTAIVTSTESALKDAIGLMVQLEETLTPQCDNRTLVDLRRLAFQSSVIKDFGVLNENGALICTGVMGQLPTPYPASLPDVVIHHGNTPIELRFLRQLIATQIDSPAIVMQVGRFNAVLTPTLATEIAESGIDMLRALPQPGTTLATTVVANPRLSNASLESLADAALLQGNTTRWDWRAMGLIHSTALSSVPFILQRITTLRHAVTANPELNQLLSVLALTFALLAFFFARDRIRTWGTMDSRIDEMLRPEHILCHYQPIVEIATSQIVGCEVLVRLRDGNTTLTPDKFMPSVITRKLTGELDRLVTTKALRTLSAALPTGQSLSVAINLFPSSIRADEFHANVLSAMGEHPHPGLSIFIEVIEQDYHGGMLEEIAKLKGLGYGISVDDFGTGYSNLGSVRNIAPHKLKIDRSFVHDMHSQTVRSTLIPEMVAIARATGADVVAEGVENEAQRQTLKEMGVRYGQGYLFARPMPLMEFINFLEMRTPKASGPNPVNRPDVSTREAA